MINRTELEGLIAFGIAALVCYGLTRLITRKGGW